MVSVEAGRRSGRLGNQRRDGSLSACSRDPEEGAATLAEGRTWGGGKPRGGRPRRRELVFRWRREGGKPGCRWPRGGEPGAGRGPVQGRTGGPEPPPKKRDPGAGLYIGENPEYVDIPGFGKVNRSFPQAQAYLDATAAKEARDAAQDHIWEVAMYILTMALGTELICPAWDISS